MQLHIFEENERCVKIDVRQNTLLEDIIKLTIKIFTFVFTFLLAPRKDCCGFLRKSPSKLYIVQVFDDFF